jgi:hypothetical protein
MDLVGFRRISKIFSKSRGESPAISLRHSIPRILGRRLSPHPPPYEKWNFENFSKFTFQARWAWFRVQRTLNPAGMRQSRLVNPQISGINSEPHESGLYCDQLDELSTLIPISNRFDAFWIFDFFRFFPIFDPKSPQAFIRSSGFLNGHNSTKNDRIDSG